MTALAAVAGMLPLALGLGESGETQAPMGRAIIGGVITSTLLTLLALVLAIGLVGLLLLTPVLYMVFGFVFTVIAAWIYNLVAARIGGFEFTHIAPDPVHPNLVYSQGWYGSPPFTPMPMLMPGIPIGSSEPHVSFSESSLRHGVSAVSQRPDRSGLPSALKSPTQKGRPSATWPKPAVLPTRLQVSCPFTMEPSHQFWSPG